MRSIVRGRAAASALPFFVLSHKRAEQAQLAIAYFPNRCARSTFQKPKALTAKSAKKGRKVRKEIATEFWSTAFKNTGRFSLGKIHLKLTGTRRTLC
jgi:hypothetical protein